MGKFSAKIKYCFIFCGLGFALFFSWIFGLVVPAFYCQIPKMLIYPFGISWCILLFLAMVGMDRIVYYLLLPKNERGNFFYIKKAGFIRTIDLSELRKSEEEES